MELKTDLHTLSVIKINNKKDRKKIAEVDEQKKKIIYLKKSKNG